MLNLISGDVVADGTKLHYYRSGGEKPPLVCVHGITDDGLCWAPVAEALCGEFDVILVDMRGHGRSEAPEDGYTLEKMARELAGLIQALGLEKPVILGHSMGAIATLTLAGLFPELPSAILLEDPPAFWRSQEDDFGRAQNRNSLEDWIYSNKRKTWDDLLAELRTNNPTWSEAEVKPWIDSKHLFSLKIAALVNPADLVSINFPSLVRRISCPALFISADPKCGAASGEDDIARLKVGLPQLQVVQIPGAGHSIRRDQFDRYMAVVRQALVELQAKEKSAAR